MKQPKLNDRNADKAYERIKELAELHEAEHAAKIDDALEQVTLYEQWHDLDKLPEDIIRLLAREVERLRMSLHLAETELQRIYADPDY